MGHNHVLPQPPLSNLRMWAVIPLAKDKDFPRALWYGKCPRSLRPWTRGEGFEGVGA